MKPLLLLQSLSLNICLHLPFFSLHGSCAGFLQDNMRSTQPGKHCSPMTQTALQYKLYPSVTLGISPYGVPFMAPNMCSCRGPSQLANPNPVYYLWKDINSRDCDPLRLNGPLRPSIIMTSIQGREFMWRMGYNMIYVNNAYL